MKVNGFDVDFEPAAFDRAAQADCVAMSRISLPRPNRSFRIILSASPAALKISLVALPIFVTRGMVQRKFVMRREYTTPKDLRGRTIGMGRVFGATSVYLRALLADHFGVARNAARWITAEPLTSDSAIGGEWAYTHQRGGMKASELVQRLSAGDLDAVIYPGGAGGHWFNWVVEGGASRTPDPYGDLEQMVASSSNLCFPVGDVESHLAWFNQERIYPTYHFLGIRKSVAANHAGLTDALVDAFQRATSGAPAYMSDEERKLYEREQELLGSRSE